MEIKLEECYLRSQPEHIYRQEILRSRITITTRQDYYITGGGAEGHQQSTSEPNEGPNSSNSSQVSAEESLENQENTWSERKEEEEIRDLDLPMFGGHKLEPKTQEQPKKAPKHIVPTAVGPGWLGSRIKSSNARTGQMGQTMMTLV